MPHVFSGFSPHLRTHAHTCTTRAGLCSLFLGFFFFRFPFWVALWLRCSNLRHNNIKEIVSAAWRSNRARRAWTSPCDGTVYADTDNNLDGTIDDADWHQSNGYHSAADGESGDVAIYGDHNSPYADSVNTTFISAFPQSSLACLLKIYSLYVAVSLSLCVCDSRARARARAHTHTHCL